MVIEQELKLVVWIWDALRSQKEDQTMVVELWTAFRARGQKPFPETGPFFFGHDEFTTVRHILIPDLRVRKRGRLIVPEICRKNNMFPRSVFLNLYFLAKIYVANNANRKMHYSWDPIKIERKTTIKIQFQKWDPILIHFRGGAPS